MTIETKLDSYNNPIYTAIPPKGTKLRYPIGWFPTEVEAVAAYNQAL